jgi:hypothetical protein
MMGPERLSEIRAKVRKAFNGTDAELLAWFNLQLEEGAQKPKPNTESLDSLRLLRDALLKQGKPAKPRRGAGTARR